MKRIFLSLLVLATAFTTKAQTADEVIAKHITAIGGADNWKKVNSMKMEGLLQANGADVNVTVTILHGKGMRQDISVMGMTGYEIVTPTEGWNFMPFQGQQEPEAKTPEALAEAQDNLDAQGGLIDYVAKGHKVELLGKEDVEGTECFKLKMTKKGGSVSTLFIDPKSFYIVQSKTIQKANGQEMEVVTSYSNYEKLPEGVIVAKSMTLPFGELNMSKITINGPVDESIFKK
jgi:hypothetical protein